MKKREHSGHGPLGLSPTQFFLAICGCDFKLRVGKTIV